MISPNKKLARIIALGVFLLAAGCFLIFSQSVQAQEWNQGMANFQQETGLTNQELPVIIGRIVRIVLGFLGLIAVIIIITGGFIWLTSGGNPEKINQAKKIIISGLIGLAIIVFSYAIASFILNILWGRFGPGAGGGQGGGIGPGTLPQGANYLVIIDKYPKNNQAVPRNITVTIAFNRPLNCETVKYGNGSGDTIKIMSGNNLVPGHIRVQGNTIIFKTDVQCPGVLGGLACQPFNSCPPPEGGPCHVGRDSNQSNWQCAPLPEGKTSLSCCPVGTFCCSCFSPGQYTLTLIGGNNGIKSLDGKILPSASISWNFTVTSEINSDPPKVSSRAPAPNSQNVPRNVGIAVTFSKPIDLSTLRVYGDPAKCPQAVSEIGEASVRVTKATNGEPISGCFEKITSEAFIFRPDNPCPSPYGERGCKCFDANVGINVTLIGSQVDDQTKAIRDTNCNVLDCDDINNCQWRFDTSSEVDLEPPKIAKVNNQDLVVPPNQTPPVEDVDRLTTIEGTFNEPIDPTSVNFDSFVLVNVEPLSIESGSNPKFVLTPLSVLDAFKLYQAVFYGNSTGAGSCEIGGANLFGIRDLAGNTLQENYIWYFKTGGLVSSQDPQIISVKPATGPEGTCTTIVGYNLGCCPNGECPSGKTPADYYWDNTQGQCRADISERGKIEVWQADGWLPVSPLDWQEINRPAECQTEPNPYCKTYSPQSQIIIQIPAGTISKENNIKITPARK
jgi:hypothetical protein